MFNSSLPLLPHFPDAMTTKWPGGFLSAKANIPSYPDASSRLIISSSLQGLQHPRHYAQHVSKPRPTHRQQYGPPTIASRPETALPQPDAVKSALKIVSANAEHDPINPPRSTIPPSLDLPERGNDVAPKYWFNLGRAYGRFYKDGIKAVWYNYKASRLLREHLRTARGAMTVTDAIRDGVISRAEFQLLARNHHDIGKLPLFALMVIVFGEWLVLIVPFVPNTVPGTCRIPKQINGMQEKAEERRRRAFMLGISEPSTDQWPGTASEKNPSSSKWPIARDEGYLNNVMGKLRPDQLYHLSSTLGLHKHIWDRLQLPPPSFLLRRAVRRHLQYLARDDLLLLNALNSNSKEQKPRNNLPLNPSELRIALSERGFDIRGYNDKTLQERLMWWLQRQARDEGQGRAMLAMLFRRLVMSEWVRLNLQANETFRPGEQDSPRSGTDGKQ